MDDTRKVQVSVSHDHELFMMGERYALQTALKLLDGLAKHEAMSKHAHGIRLAMSLISDRVNVMEFERAENDTRPGMPE